MATTHYLIGRVTVGSDGSSTINFSNIPQTYTDLKVVISARSDADVVGVTCSINGSALDSGKRLRGNGVGVASTSATENYAVNNAVNSTSSTFSNGEWYFPNYTGSYNKSVSMDGVTENNGTDAYSSLVSGYEATASAISSLSFAPTSGNFIQYSTAYLYGVSKTGDSTKAPYASGGDVIATDGTYWIHTFKSSGTFTPIKNLTADYLVVAGGGGGGKGANSGGGGAGGLRSTVTATGGGGSLESALSLTSGTGYTVTVGGGGAGGATDGTSGTNGSNSVFSTITSAGGGGGGGSGSKNGIAGGSGGGGGLYETVGGAGTANQGYAGGPNIGLAGDPTKFRAGGGGGAGAIGGGAAASVGTGGAGVATSITGSSVTYAGGGGGGANDGIAAGGAGGGGAAGSAGTANTGGGGGGAGNSGGNNISAGGSGVVIIRYPV